MRSALLLPLFGLLLGFSDGYPLSCYYSGQGVDAEFSEHSACAVSVDNRYEIAPEHLAAVSFDQTGIGTLLINQQWLYVRADGSTLTALTYDNGPDYFAEGLVRAQINGRIGYFDQNLQQVIAPLYDWGWPFEDGRALVCKGCKVRQSKDHEHSQLEGGLWGYINQQGVEVVPVQLSQAQAYSH